MKSWEDYLPEVILSCDCPEPMAIKSIRDSAIEFLGRAHLWTQELDPIPVSTSVEDYELEMPDQAQLVTVEYVEISDRTIYPITEKRYDNAAPSWRDRWRDRESSPLYFWITKDKNLRLFPIPTAEDEGDEFIAGAILKPTRVSYEGPDFLYDDYAEDIGQGALYRLFSMKGRAWYDLQAAGAAKTRYSTAIFNGRADADKSRGKGSNRMKLRPMA